MATPRTLISVGDFEDLYFKIKQKGLATILSKFHLDKQSRIFSKWNEITPSSDFWIIPQVRRRWNLKCTGNPDLSYEDYVVAKYLAGKTNLRMLSVGCGTGARERKFAQYPVFDSIEGIDVATKQIEEAKTNALNQNLHNLQYFAADFITYNFPAASYDIILFNSSLHHFPDIDTFLKTKVLPLLKPKGLLVIFEYVGPNRLQWTTAQLQKANELLIQIPLKYRLRQHSKSTKNKIYRPGLLRMALVDPSEAIDSEAIIPTLHKYCKIIEEKKLGWDITHILLKGIAHNFIHDDAETHQLLAYIFEQEDIYLAETGRSDGVFGIYQKK